MVVFLRESKTNEICNGGFETRHYMFIMVLFISFIKYSHEFQFLARMHTLCCGLSNQINGVK